MCLACVVSGVFCSPKECSTGLATLRGVLRMGVGKIPSVTGTVSYMERYNNSPTPYDHHTRA